MTHKLRTLSVIVMLLGLLGLAACAAPSPTSTPTLDLNPIRTEVAATVLAQVTRAQVVFPSVTPLPSPTATTTTPPTSTPTPAGSPLPSATLSTRTVTPTAQLVNLAEWVSQTIADDTYFLPNQTFTMTWRLKNVGTSTWTADYLLRYYSGNAFSALKEIPIGRVVQPGDSIDITIRMRSPATSGSYRSDWVMSTPNRSNFKEPVYLKITVALAGTPSPTP